MLLQKDIDILRPLIARYAEIAALPVQNEKRQLWKNNNQHSGNSRPMVLIDQICWSELEGDESLHLQCEDPYWREIENKLRQMLYRWKHFPVDLVYDPYLLLPKPMHNTGWGLQADEKRISMDIGRETASHEYHDIMEEEESLEKIQMPEITLDTEKMEQIRQEADILCQGLIPYVMQGFTMHLGIWDTISTWRGVEACFIDIYDRPEYLHAIMEKLTQGLLYQIDTLNRLKAYDLVRNITHCSHTYRDDLPGKLENPNEGTTDKGWAFGLAQLFTSCSPEVTEEFEVPYMQRVFPHFGAIYYGCCERLDDRLDVLAKLPKVQKISCSPWSDRDHFAEVLPDRYVMSAKPNPALLAAMPFSEEAVRQDLRHTIDAARRYGKNLELLQKDISTLRMEPDRLDRWAKIAMEEVQR